MDELVAYLMPDEGFLGSDDEFWIPVNEFMRKVYQNDHLMTKEIKQQYRRIKWKRRTEGYPIPRNSH
jgi:hypothetical protein